MKTFRNVLVVMTAIAMLGTVVGCAGTQQQRYSGFLDSYPPMKKGPGDVDLRYLKPGVDFNKYNKVMMDEVVFFFKTDGDYHGIHPSEINELSDAFHKIYVQELGNILTDKPGSDVVRMRLALTDLEPSKPAQGAMTTVVPMGLAVSLAKKGATGEYMGIGSASCEVEFIDSVTNERVAVGIDKYPGGKLDIGKMSAAKAAFKYWADRLAAFIRSW